MSVLEPSTYFLSQRIGRWKFRWVLASFLASVVVATVASFVLVGVVGVVFDLANESGSNPTSVTQTTPKALAVDLMVVGITFWVPAIVGTWIHGRSVRSLVAPLTGFRWSIVRKVVGFELIALLLLTPWQFVTTSETLAFSGFRAVHLLWLVPIALLVLVQTSGEDAFFKGYLLRQLGAATKVAWLAPIVVTMIFVSLHIGNADLMENVWLILPLFVAGELVSIYLLMRTGGMEVSLVLHWLNNSFIFLLIAERTSQSNDLTLIVHESDPATLTDDYLLVAVSVVILVARLIAFTWRRSPFFLEPHGWQPDGDRRSTGQHGTEAPHAAI